MGTDEILIDAKLFILPYLHRIYNCAFVPIQMVMTYIVFTNPGRVGFRKPNIHVAILSNIVRSGICCEHKWS